MKRNYLYLLSGLTLGFVSLNLILSRLEAQAQPAYGSYIGAAVAIGERNNEGDNLDFSAVAAGRYKFLELPLSFRSQIFIDGVSLAWVPTVSIDLPLTWQLEPYIGAGVSFTTENSVVGDKTAFVVQPGIDYAVPNSRVVLFGNAVIAIDAFDEGRKDGQTALSVQSGIGYRF